MIVCSCNNINEAAIRACASHAHCRPSVAEIYTTLGHRPNCGICAKTIKAIVADVAIIAERGESCSTCPVKGQTDAARHRAGKEPPAYDFLIGLPGAA